jgi:hypothetical protein
MQLLQESSYDICPKPLKIGDLSWLKAVGVRRGTPEITFLGWSSCLGCGRRFDRKPGYLGAGTRGGDAGQNTARPPNVTNPWKALAVAGH